MTTTKLMIRMLAGLVALTLLVAACGDDSGTSADDTAGDDTAGDDTAGDDTAGDDTAGDDTAGDDTAGDDTAGADDTAGDDTAGDDTAGDDTAGDDTAGDDTAGADDTAGDDTAGADDTAGDDTAGADDTSEPDPEPTMGDIQESFVGGIASGAAVVDGEVKVYFNNGAAGNIVAIYHGAGLADPAGLCPGNSLNLGGNDFQFISNAPASPGACDGFPSPVGSVRVCTSGVWLYQTMIPNDSVGTLFGSLERLGPDGGFLNMNAQVPNMANTPVIDYSLDSYSISAMFTNDGSEKITCDPPLT